MEFLASCEINEMKRYHVKIAWPISQENSVKYCYDDNGNKTSPEPSV